MLNVFNRATAPGLGQSSSASRGAGFPRVCSGPAILIFTSWRVPITLENEIFLFRTNNSPPGFGAGASRGAWSGQGSGRSNFRSKQTVQNPPGGMGGAREGAEVG